MFERTPAGARRLRLANRHRSGAALVAPLALAIAAGGAAGVALHRDPDEPRGGHLGCLRYVFPIDRRRRREVLAAAGPALPYLKLDELRRAA